MEFLTCESCRSLVIKRGAMQRYCTPCSELRSQRRNGPRKTDGRKSEIVHRGIEISKQSAKRGITDHQPFNADDGWMVSFKVPFTQASSKNHVWSLAKGAGYVFKRQQSRAFQDLIAHKVKSATKGIRVCQNKIWIEIFVQKPHHKGDAINTLDVICDGLKVGLGVDDRWFCVRQVDWEIAKHDPQIFISVYQSQEHDIQACSHCGRLLPLDKFRKKKTARMGVDRVCKDCGGKHSIGGVE